MANVIHINTARKMFEAGDAMDIRFWDSHGNIITASNVICTSSYFENNTINIKFLISKQFRKVRVISIFEVNGMEVFI